MMFIVLAVGSWLITVSAITIVTGRFPKVGGTVEMAVIVSALGTATLLTADGYFAARGLPRIAPIVLAVVPAAAGACVLCHAVLAALLRVAEAHKC